MLTKRQARILELVIREYVESAQPVGSQHLQRTYQLDVSSATVRSEMAELEAHGYLDHPHTSAGRVPTEKGYRVYVGQLMREEELPWDVQQTIRHQFHQVERGREAWVHLAASVLARSVENAAVVTPPHAPSCRIKHLELVSLQDDTALLVLVLDQGRLQQQVLTLDETHTQDELRAVSARLNELFGGLTLDEVTAKDVELTRVERAVMDAVESVLRAIEEGNLDETYLEGVRHMLRQPEFAASERVVELLELLEAGNLARVIPLRTLARQGLTVIIGAEHPRLARAGEAMRACSVIIGGYGDARVGAGALAVLGPMRMRYPRTVSTVRYLANLMSEMLSGYYE